MPNPVAIGETASQTALPAQVDIYDFDKTGKYTSTQG